MNLTVSMKTAFLLYDQAWKAAIPFLSKNRRLAQGLSQRTLESLPRPADVWMQAASAGESYLAVEILRHIRPHKQLKVLVTSNTQQGMDILHDGLRNLKNENPALVVKTAFFPFDRPVLMHRFVRHVSPRLAVLLETEIWPGMLMALKKNRVRTLLVNGRINASSLKHYQVWPDLWPRLAPDRVLAVTPEDASRFSRLFNAGRGFCRTCCQTYCQVGVMPNIKFDRIQDIPQEGSPAAAGLVHPLIGQDVPFVVLGSTREPEEADVEKMIRRIMTAVPETVIGLFPRHMHRIPYWRSVLNRMGAPWRCRSALNNNPVRQGVILWDVFGELTAGYNRADAVFVGGSLARLGGQNFLEPLMFGLRPVTGPSWKNFYWIGRAIFDQELVRMAPDWKAAAAELIRDLHNIPDLNARDHVRARAAAYIKKRRGGTHAACSAVVDMLFAPRATQDQ